MPEDLKPELFRTMKGLQKTMIRLRQIMDTHDDLMVVHNFLWDRYREVSSVELAVVCMCSVGMNRVEMGCWQKGLLIHLVPATLSHNCLHVHSILLLLGAPWHS